MKINYKRRLVEADEPITELNPANASADELANAIKNDVEEITDGKKEITDASAKELAKDIKNTAGEVGADAAEIIITPEDYDEIEINNRLIPILDEALEASKNAMDDGDRAANNNILISGLPGSGKTAIVEAWAKKRGLHLVAVNATDPKIETSINGMPLRDNTKPDQNVVTVARSDLLKDLEDPQYAGQCVLFVDEYNRQPRNDLRRAFLSLFNEKRNADGSLDFSKNLLFTIVCINPSGLKYQDKGVAELGDVERTRFVNKLYGFDSEAKETLSYFNGRFSKELLDLGILKPGTKAAARHGISGITRQLTDKEKDKLKRYILVHALARHILAHPDFEYTAEEDLDRIHNAKTEMLNARILTQAIIASAGDPKKFLDWVNNRSALGKDEQRMFKKILDTYIIDLPALYKEIGVSYPDPNKVIAKDTGEAEADTSANTTPADVEDDEDLFTQADNTGKVSADVDETTQRVLDALNNLNL